MSVLEETKRLTASGFSIIPVKADGSKAPTIPWKPFQSRMPTIDEIAKWFDANVGIAVIAGKISGNLEIIDFDDESAFEIWRERIKSADGEALLKSLPAVFTPSGGRHVFYRCQDGVERNQKLAVDGHKKVRIETRGEGGDAPRRSVDGGRF